MSIPTAFSKQWPLLALAGALIVVLVSTSGGTLIHSEEPDPTAVFACVNKSSGEVKIVEHDDACKKNADKISWPLVVGGEVQADSGFKAGANSTTYGDGFINLGLKPGSSTAANLDIDSGTLVIKGQTDTVNIGKTGHLSNLNVLGTTQFFGVATVSGPTTALRVFNGDFEVFTTSRTAQPIVVDTSANRVSLGKKKLLIGGGPSFRVVTTFDVDGANNRVSIGSVAQPAALDVVGATSITGNVTVNSNLNVDSGTLFVDGTSNEVGIGTTTPSEKLDVAGTVEMTGFKLTTSPTSGYVLTANASGVGTWQAAPAGGGGGGGADSDWTISGNDMYSAVSGNVGIGTTTPSGKLGVVGAVVITGDVTINSNLTVDTGTLFVNGANGNVGIGTTSPSTPLHIEAASPVEVKLQRNGGGNLDLTYDYDGTHRIGFTDGGAPGNWLFRVNFSDGTTWLAPGVTGKVGIGTDSPSAKLDVNGVVKANGYDMTVYTAGGPTAASATLSSANTWGDFPDLSLTFTLAEPTTVMAHYEIAMQAGGVTGNRHLVTRLDVDGTVVSRSLTGNEVYWSEDSNWFGELAAGNHTIKVQYRTPGGGTNNPAGSDYQNRILQVLVFAD